MELLVEKDWSSRRVKIYLREENGDRTTIIGQNRGKLFAQDILPNDFTVRKFHPLLEMPDHLFHQFAAAFSEYNSKNHNYRSKNENLIEGKLQATERHLEDLREFSKVLINTLTNKPI